MTAMQGKSVGANLDPGLPVVQKGVQIPIVPSWTSSKNFWHLSAQGYMAMLMR